MKNLRALLGYLKPYWKYALFAPAFMMIEVFFDLLQPSIMRNVIDIGIANSDRAYVINNGVFMILASLAAGGAAVLSIIFSSKAGVFFGADLRRDLFIKIQRLSFKNLDNLETGHLITRLTNDVKQVQDSVMMALVMLVRAPFLLLGSIFMAVVVCPQFIGIMIVVVFFLLILIVYFFNKITPIYKRVQGKIDDLNRISQENITGVRVVKAFVRKDYEINKFQIANAEMMETSMSAARTMAKLFPSMTGIINLGVVAVLYFGGLGAMNGTIQVGQIMAFINYLLQISFAMLMVAMVFTRLTRAEASAERIGEVLNETMDIRNVEKPLSDFNSNGDVVFKNVSFSYKEDANEAVLRGIDFTAKKGETVAILGQTGAGKTSFVELISRFYDVTEGKLEIGGVDIRNMDKSVLRSRVGFALQNSVLFKGSIRQNICFGLDATDEDRMIRAAKAACAHDFIMSFPNGYDTNVNQKGISLSGGQKQRIAIARALIIDPDILILDDSTSAVDVTTESKIQDALKTIMANKTSFIIAQRISTVLDADTIIIIDNGKIVAEGSHEKLIVESQIYQAIYDSQLGGREVS